MNKLEQIERYLDGAMSGKEKEDFEKSVIEDKKFAAELNFHKEVNEAILDDETMNFRQTIKNITEQNTSEIKFANKSLINMLKIPLAASVLVLIGFSLFNILIRQNPSKLYTSFYEPYNTDISTRSAEYSKESIQLSYYLYQEGDYQSSYEILKNYISKNFDDKTAHFYMGLNAMELSYYDQAIDEFVLVEQDTLSPFALHARWYLALTYMKTGNIKIARFYLQRIIEEENMYSANAKKILKKL